MEKYFILLDEIPGFSIGGIALTLITGTISVLGKLTLDSHRREIESIKKAIENALNETKLIREENARLLQKMNDYNIEMIKEINKVGMKLEGIKTELTK